MAALGTGPPFSALGRWCLWFERQEAKIITVTAAVLIVIAEIPIWAVHFPPLQDYPIHLLRANIIAHYSDLTSRYYDTFVVSLAPIPYILTDYILSGLALMLPIAIAGKIMLAIYIVLLPVSFFYLLRSIAANKLVLGFFSFLLIYNRHFEKGNTSYFFSFPLFMFALGYWWRHRIRPTWGHKAVLSGLIVAVYLCHLYTLLFLFFSIVVLAWFEFRSVRKVFGTLLPFLPSILILCISLASQTSQFKPPPMGVFKDPVVMEYPSLKGKLLAVVNGRFEMPYLMTFSPWRERRIFIASAVLFGFLLLGSLRAQRSSAFSWLFLALSLLYLLLPQFVSPEWDVAPRTLIFILLIAPVCLSPPRSPPLRLVVAIFLVLLSVYSLRGTWRDYRSVSSNLDDYYAVLKQIPPGERASFRVDKDSMYMGNITPYALFGIYYYMESGAIRAADMGREMWAVLRSVEYRRIEAPPPQLEDTFSGGVVDPGGYAIVLLRNQQAAVAYLAQKYGYRTVLETHDIGVYRKVRNVPSLGWFPGRYYVLGLKDNYNYLFLWQNAFHTDPAIAQQFELVSSRENAQLWRRRHLLDESSTVELCIPCGDLP
jgi:hypothetical protein